MIAASALTYRPISATDGPALFRLFTQLHADEIGALSADACTCDALASMRYVEERVRLRAEFPDAVEVAIEHDGVFCGQVISVLRESGMQLVALCVLAEYRGKGVGSAAMHRLARIAEEHGCRIWLRADSGSSDCRGFLERVGFTVTGRSGRLVVARAASTAAA